MQKTSLFNEFCKKSGTRRGLLVQLSHDEMDRAEAGDENLEIERAIICADALKSSVRIVEFVTPNKDIWRRYVRDRRSTKWTLST